MYESALHIMRLVEFNSSLTYLSVCLSVFLPSFSFFRSVSLSLLRVIPAVLSPQVDGLLELIQQMLYQALICPHINVTEAATTAISSFIISIESPSLRHKLAELLPHMITVSELKK